MTIYEQAQALQPYLAELQREFHEHPEPSRGEKETSARVLRELEKIGGWSIRTNVYGYGILADLQGGKPGKRVALRADMDALQITEESGLPYASRNPGLMHACGHDNHITMLLGAAKLLAQNKADIPGSVRLIFQPSEELSPHGGAKGMIAAGAMQDVDAVFGLHVWPGLPMGTFGTRAGALMAASDHFSVMIKGKSCHGAMPHLGCDATVAGAQIVTALQSIVSRNVDPMKSAVITIGRLHSGTRYNIVAETCELEGTCRTFDPAVRMLCRDRLTHIVQNVAEAMGCECEVNYELGYNAVQNDPAMADYLLHTASELFGAEHAVRVPGPAMTAEDFAFYLQEAPGSFAWLGVDEPGKEVWPLHSCRLATPADILWRGSALFTQMVLNMK